MGMKKNATQWAQNWADKYGAAGPAMTAGANAVVTAPSQQALQPDAVAKMKAKWQAAVAPGGKWETATSKVTLADWKQAYITKGVVNAQNSIGMAKAKVTNYAQKAIPVYQTILAQIDAMPRATLNDSIQRAAAWMTKLQEAANNGQLA